MSAMEKIIRTSYGGIIARAAPGGGPYLSLDCHSPGEEGASLCLDADGARELAAVLLAFADGQQQDDPK